MRPPWWTDYSSGQITAFWTGVMAIATTVLAWAAYRFGLAEKKRGERELSQRELADAERKESEERAERERQEAARRSEAADAMDEARHLQVVLLAERNMVRIVNSGSHAFSDVLMRRYIVGTTEDRNHVEEHTPPINLGTVRPNDPTVTGLATGTEGAMFSIEYTDHKGRTFLNFNGEGPQRRAVITGRKSTSPITSGTAQIETDGQDR